MSTNMASETQVTNNKSSPSTSSRQRLPSTSASLRRISRGPVPIAPYPTPSPSNSGIETFEGRPVQLYCIHRKWYMMQRPENETKAMIERATVGGRRLRYTLDIIQEPEKARACGNGPRAATDRRPVDPPPVITLLIRDIDTGEDVTMSYDASFMLYASLEAARPIAFGTKQMHPAPPSLPVLSGVSVASANYLTQPTKAAYFVFPDLSVRHEGWYRLKFSLFEQVKHHLDADVERPFLAQDNTSEPLAHEAMANRIEVVSRPFQVFSAKKFPGLGESTSTSRILAEQGCRVRIRRQIRQRKRSDNEVKPEPRNATPEWTSPAHSRAASRNSMDGPYPPIDPLRRTSMESLYQSRPIPSRQHSQQSSIMHASPTTPTVPQLSMPPPPAQRMYESPALSPTLYQRGPSYYQQPPPPSNYLPPPQSPRGLSSDPDSSRQLPPINTFQSAPLQSRPLYMLPEPTATKRSASRTFDNDGAMKAGARPDHQSRPPCLSNPGTIEVDNSPEDDDHHTPMEYPRANGSRAKMGIQNLLS